MNIPSGSVTFLFTDIEGSTRLAQEFPDTLRAALEKHNSILTKAFESNNGFVFEIVGDAYCCAYENAADAVKTAVEVQINLSKVKWEDAVIKIRIGIHSGKAEWNGKTYQGYITLARTSRVMSATYGEQILISNETYELAKEEFIIGVPGLENENGNREICIERDWNRISFRDLGERRLKDLIQPMRLFQIVSPELAADFPPLKTLDARPNNIPFQLTNFIGREEEIKQIKNLIQQTHLLTLTGPGGGGKTRLALQVSADIIDDFANGVWIAELASLLDPGLLPQAIAQAIGIQEQPKQSPEDTLIDFLQDKNMLIILDNCEHIVEHCANLSEKLLINCPGLKIIATSREELRCRGEQTHRIQSLKIPNPKEKISLEKLYEYEAVILFIERAIAVNSKFTVNEDNAHALAEICYQLDGIPLAIELAASKVTVLSVEKLNIRLDDRFKLLTGGKRTAMPRQQTLRALIDWSYDLLLEQEKLLWGRLSVFAGGWTMEAAEAICSDEKIRAEEVLDLLSNLTEKSIIIFDDEKERYRMLESIRQYGMDKLSETGDRKVISRNHLKYYMKFAESAEVKLIGSEMKTWLGKLDEDSGNFEKALLLSSEKVYNEEVLRLAGALGYYWKIRGHFSAGSRWLENVLLNSPEVINSARGKALCLAGILARHQGEYEKAVKYNEESLRLSREIQDEKGIALSLNSLGNVANDLGKYEQAQKFYEESLSLNHEISDKRTVASSLNNLGNVAIHQGYFEQARKFYEDSLTLQRKISDKRGIAESLNNLGNVEWCMENYKEAQKFYEESLALFNEMSDNGGKADSLTNLGNIAFVRENFEQAQKIYEECLSLFRKIGDKRGIAYTLNSLGSTSHNLQNYEQAGKFFTESLKLFREMRDKRLIAESLYELGYLEYIQGNYEPAQILFKESLTLNREMQDKHAIANSLIGFAYLFCARDDLSRAAIVVGAVKATFKCMGINLHGTELKFHEKIINKLHEKLRNEEFEKYFEEGEKLTLEQTVEMAMSS